MENLEKENAVLAQKVKELSDDLSFYQHSLKR